MRIAASCWHGNSHGNMYSWHKKIYSIISFVSGFFLDVSAAKPISVFSLWSFRFDVFLLLEELLFTTVQLISFDISPHCSTLLYSLWLKDAVHQLIKVTPKMTLLSCQSSYIAIAPFQPANHVRVRTTVRIVYWITKSSSTLNFLILRLRPARTKARLII